MTVRRVSSLTAATLLLQACSTIYAPPAWENGTYSDATSVRRYIDGHISTYTRLMRQLGQDQDMAAAAIILAALGGTTAMALGAGTHVGILAGSAGGAISQSTSYAKPGDRLKLLSQATDATTCIRDEYVNQQNRTAALGLSEHRAAPVAAAIAPAQNFVMQNSYLMTQITDAGEIAVDATRAVSTSLQVKLVNVSQVPDYTATVTALKNAQAAADANKPPPGTGGKVAQLVSDISDYQARIETCKAKLPS